MPKHWYVLQTKAQKEGLVVQQLKQREMSVFYPFLPVRPVNPRARTVQPFFPCYVFVYVDLAEVGVSQFQYLPHAVGLVSFGDRPAEVEQSLVEQISMHLEQINAAGDELLFRLHSGDPVMIERGPFAGYEAIFDARLRNSDRVRVLLELIGQQQVALNIYIDEISAQV